MEGEFLRAGLLKAVPKAFAPEENITLFKESLGWAAREGVELFVTCECFLDGYASSHQQGHMYDRVLKCAQAPSSPFLGEVRDAAAGLKMHIVFGFIRRTETGMRNSVIFVDDSGKDIGIYDKTHLMEDDIIFYEPGEGLPVFETKWGKLGLMICADRRFPETARTLKLRGARMIINPSYGMWGEENEWMMRTRAAENEAPILFAHPKVSLALGPQGQVWGKLVSNRPALLVQDIALSTQEQMMPARRGDIYHRG